MTAIVGLVDDGVVYIGGDSATTDGWLNQSTMAGSKVFERSDFLFGVAGSIRALQLVEHKFQIPWCPVEVPCETYMVTQFLDSMRECFLDSGYLKKQHEEEEMDSAFLIGHEGKLFTLHVDFALVENNRGYAAIGSGAEIAQGAMYATADRDDLTPKERIRIALRAAEQHNAGVRRPFIIKSLK